MKNKMMIRMIILVASVLMIVYGINAGGFKDVLGRAIMVCLECVGIG